MSPGFSGGQTLLASSSIILTSHVEASARLRGSILNGDKIYDADENFKLAYEKKPKSKPYAKPSKSY